VNREDVPEGPLLVDTDVATWLAYDRGRYAEFGPLVEDHLLALSFASVAELRAGAVIAQLGERRRQMLESIIGRYVVITATDEVTRQWAELHARFRDRLKGGGVNDMWIAACSLAQPTPIPVVTGNLSDFQTIAEEFPLPLVHPDI
jgi:predicted nucleic acid-binding protein